MKRRLAVLLLALCLAAVILPVGAFAGSDDMVDVTFRLRNGSWPDGQGSAMVWQMPLGYVLETGDLPQGMAPYSGFGGGYWQTDPVGVAITEPVTFWYIFQQKLTVTFHPQGGGWPDGAQVKTADAFLGDPCGAMPPDPERAGFLFAGWASTPGPYGGIFDENSPVEDNLDLYARWVQAVTVTFDAGEGWWPVEEWDPEQESMVQRQETLRFGAGGAGPAEDGLFPENPTRPGYVFDGWETQDAEPFGPGSDLGADRTVNARWLLVYTLTFDPNADQVEGLPEPEENTLGIFDLPEQVPCRPGHDFLGWSTDRLAQTGENFEEGVRLSGPELTLYAVWKRQLCRAVFTLPDGRTFTREALWGQTAAFPTDEELGLTGGFWQQEGETFRLEGWETGDGSLFAPDRALREDVQLRPRLILQAAVTFRIENGLWQENGAQEMTVTLDQGAELTGKIPTPTPNAGYKPGSWTQDPALHTADQGAEYTYTCVPLELFTVILENGEGVPDTRLVTEGQPIGTLPTPERPGWNFLGWFTAETGGEPWTAERVVTEDLTLFARFAQLPTITLRYDANGGQGAPEAESVVTDSPTYTFTVSTQAPALADHTFQGWARDPKAPAAEYHGGDPCSAAGEVTLYAVWQKVPESVSVTFWDRGERYAQLTWAYNSRLPMLPEPDREGWRFLGWNTEEDGSGQTLDGSTLLTQDMTVFSQWRQIREITVTFLDQGQEVLVVEMEAETALTQMPGDPVREGYDFLGWNTCRDGSGTDLHVGTILTDNTAAYACWQEITDRTVRFMDRDQEVAAVTVERGARLGLLMPKDPVRPGYTFEGWNTRPDGTGKKLYNSTVIQEDMEVYALWQQIRYVTVTFVDRGKIIREVELVQGTKVGDWMPENPTRTGYSFKGWYPDGESIRPKLSRSTLIQEDLEVHALWAKKSGNPKTGDRILGWAAAALVSGLGLAIVLRKRKR